MTSPFVYITEYAVIYGSPSWVHLFKQKERERQRRGKQQEKKCNTRTRVFKFKKKIWESFQVTIYTNEKIDTSVLNHRVVEGRLLKAAVIWAYRQQMQRCGTSLQNNQVPKNQFSFTLSFR